MTKKDIVIQLRAAKAAHIQWRAYAQAIVNGFSIDQNHVPVIHTNCKFGQWYYGKGQMLSSIPGYSAIDAPHAMLHQTYMEIFKLMFGQVQKPKGIFGKMFSSEDKMREKNAKKAYEEMEKLIDISETLLSALNALEKDVMERSDDEIAALF